MKVSSIHVLGDVRIHINRWFNPEVGGYYYSIYKMTDKVYQSGLIDDWRDALAQALDYVDNELF